MKKIIVIGAGLSSSSLISYLITHAGSHDWEITVADYNEELAKSKTNDRANSRAIKFDINDETQREREIKGADLVISMLPAMMHTKVAKDCIKYGKNLITASYISEEMKAMDSEIKEKGLIFLNEFGLDPGIDHMSAMKIIHDIKDNGGRLTDFKSYTGGLVAPEYDNNPWHYKFTWNPRNVVLAGQSVAQYLENGKYKFIPYQRLFERTETISVSSYGNFDVYPNRDSLKYMNIYGLENIQTLVRGTMRREGYCEAWNVFVQLGMTDDTYIIENSENMTFREFVELYLPDIKGQNTEDTLAGYLRIKNKSVIDKLQWLGAFGNEKTGLKKATPAQILQSFLEDKWNLEKDDKDMIVMQHQFVYEKDNRRNKIISSLVVKGINTTETAMAMTVGLPVAIGAKLIMMGKIKLTGVHLPVLKELYEPVLNELEEYGIVFEEQSFEF